ncbi:MAG TPA: dihydrodipicolinate synthase family protein [Gemmatimonadaceae bacterium]
MSLTLQGVLGPVVTTFESSGELNRTGFAENIRAHLDAGMSGIVVTGSTGEAALLDEKERSWLVEVARHAVPSDRRLLVGTGAESTRVTQRLTRLAAERGADAVLVVGPHYYGQKAVSLRDHYTAIADASPVPVILYSIPKYMHFALSPQLVAELARHENIIGIKDSSGDLDLLAGYLKAQSDGFTVLTGNGSTFRRALELGARGGILAVALIAANLSVEVFETRSEPAQDRLTPLSARIVGELGVAGVKAALDRVGLVGGPVRPPLAPLAAAELAQVTELLRVAELSLAA